MFKQLEEAGLVVVTEDAPMGRADLASCMRPTRCTTQSRIWSADGECRSPPRLAGGPRLRPVPGARRPWRLPRAINELVGAGHVEQALGDGCRRIERIAIVGDSGTGKTSITANVLGPLAEGVAPVVVPVAIESNTTVREPRAMFAHIAAVIARVAGVAAAPALVPLGAPLDGAISTSTDRLSPSPRRRPDVSRARNFREHVGRRDWPPARPSRRYGALGSLGPTPSSATERRSPTRR